MSTFNQRSDHRESRDRATWRSIRLASLFLCLLSSVLCPLQLAAQTAANPAEIKRITDRYAMTRARIGALLDLRLKPVPLPANPPNPFYQAPVGVVEPVPGHETPEVAVPEAADISDIDTLRKYAATLKIGGIIIRNGVPHLTIENTTCKVGDIITVGNKDHPIYLKMLALSPTEFTLGLNDASLSVSLRK